MHPFYGPNATLLTGSSSSWIGVVSMAMYLLFWAVVCLFAWFQIRKYLKRYFNSNFHPSPDDAVKILRERYARSEISREEFLEKKKDLEPSSDPDRQLP